MERWNAYKDTMKEMDMWYPHELIFSPALFREWHVHVEQIGSMFRDIMHQLQSLGMMIPLPGVIRALSSLGIQVPDNISVIGHDDRASGQYSSPACLRFLPVFLNMWIILSAR